MRRPWLTLLAVGKRRVNEMQLGTCILHGMEGACATTHVRSMCNRGTTCEILESRDCLLETLRFSLSFNVLAQCLSVAYWLAIQPAPAPATMTVMHHGVVLICIGKPFRFFQGHASWREPDC